MDIQIRRKKLGWIGYTLRKPTSSTTRQALSWNPQGKKKRNSRRWETEAELKTQDMAWNNATKAAKNHVDDEDCRWWPMFLAERQA